MFDAPRRRRRRRLLWPLLITVVVALAVIVATSGRDARATISYLGDMRNSASDLALAGSSLSDLVGNLSRVDRSEFQSVVSGVTDALAEAHQVAEADPPEQALVGATTLFRLAIDSWDQGISGFSTAILAAADNPDDNTAVDDLASAITDVRAGDRIYDALIEELSREDVPSPVGPMPAVSLLPMDVPITVLAPGWVLAARSETSGLPLRPSVGIQQVATKPPWVTNADGDVVVPATDALDLMVVVSNGGNTDSDPAELEMTLSTGEGDPVATTKVVPTLKAGTNTSVIFPNLTVTPGVTYQVDLALTPGGPDADLDDNTASAQFTVNAPTDTTG
jgi:hypothetical protein